MNNNEARIEDAAGQYIAFADACDAAGLSEICRHGFRRDRCHESGDDCLIDVLRVMIAAGANFDKKHPMRKGADEIRRLINARGAGE